MRVATGLFVFCYNDQLKKVARENAGSYLSCRLFCIFSENFVILFLKYAKKLDGGGFLVYNKNIKLGGYGNGTSVFAFAHDLAT